MENEGERRVLSVRVGAVRTLSDARGKWVTAFVKDAVAGDVSAGPAGLAGDAQADREVHGGRNKAILVYAASNYTKWAAERGSGRDLAWGAFGENLIVSGLDESTVCIGDEWQIGGARVQVSQPRPPCWKLARVNDDPFLPKRVLATVRGGWYLRVLSPGAIASGNEVQVIARGAAGITIVAASREMYGG